MYVGIRKEVVTKHAHQLMIDEKYREKYVKAGRESVEYISKLLDTFINVGELIASTLKDSRSAKWVEIVKSDKPVLMRWFLDILSFILRYYLEFREKGCSTYQAVELVMDWLLYPEAKQEFVEFVQACEDANELTNAIINYHMKVLEER